MNEAGLHLEGASNASSARVAARAVPRQSDRKLIVLFYKRVIAAGGAERLLLKEYKYFKQFGYAVKILSYRIDRDTLYDDELIDPRDLEELGDAYPASFVRLIHFIRRYPRAIYLCASGQIDMYLASLITGASYSLHLHQPSYMTFGLDEKYSLFNHASFARKVRESYECEAFLKTRREMSVGKAIKVNLQAPLRIGSVKRARHIFVFSEYARQEKRDLYGVESHVIAGAIEPELMDYRPQANPMAGNGYRHSLLCVARHDRNKRIDVLIRALPHLLAVQPDTVVLIGGQGPDTEKLTSLAADLGVSDRVRFLGFVPDGQLFDLYAAADLFVTLDFADYRITAFEALAVGTKVLASSEGEYEPRLLDSGYVFVSPPEPMAVARAIQAALNARPVIDRPALKAILQRYTWENMCCQIASVLDPPT